MAIIGGEATPAELLDALRTLSPSRLELISSPGARLQIATDWLGLGFGFGFGLGLGLGLGSCIPGWTF